MVALSFVLAFFLHHKMTGKWGTSWSVFVAAFLAALFYAVSPIDPFYGLAILSLSSIFVAICKIQALNISFSNLLPEEKQAKEQKWRTAEVYFVWLALISGLPKFIKLFIW